ncbi:MAG: HDOD domain-containing protein [Colwellia sp.]|nr:HDOD domain-containing protein [Colwellia sp.]
MFNTLIKRLFSLSSQKQQSNYFFFEEKKLVDLEIQKLNEAVSQKKSITCQTIISIEEKHQKYFYDVLFGESPKNLPYDELSIFIAEKIESLLTNPIAILETLPILPASLSQILEQLNNNEFDTDLLISIIEQEPALAAKVIELSNSSFYNHTSKEITNIKSAFVILGVNGLLEGVINGFISNLTPQTFMSFQLFGNKIWQHNLTTGTIAKELLTNSTDKQNIAEGYLIGLISNLGDMVIFQLLMEAFTYVHPDCQPSSSAFKTLLCKNSKKLTYRIAQYWKLPKSIVNILALQTKLTKSSMLSALFKQQPLACYIYEANLLSEFEIRLEHSTVDESDITEMKNDMIFSNEAKNYLDNLLSNILLEA